MALTTLTKLKIHLGISLSDNTEDLLLNQLIDQVDKAITRFCRRDFVSSAAVEYYDGGGREMLILKRRPVTSITGVWVDQLGFYGQATGGFAAATEWVQGVKFVSPSLAESEENGGVLLAIGGAMFAGFDVGGSIGGGLGGGGYGYAPATWPVGRGNVKVTYTAGYMTMPDDLALAANLLAASLRQMSSTGAAGPLGSETFGEYSYSVITGFGGGAGALGLDVVQARSILTHYRDVAL